MAAVDSLALRFLTTGGQTPIRSSFEQLHHPEDLEAWLSGSLDAEHPVHTVDGDFDAAVALREAIFTIIRDRTIDRTPSSDAVAVLNAAAERDPLVPRLDPLTMASRWQEPIRPVAALSTIARDAIDALSGEHGRRVRECANPNCELVFVDSSPPGARRWCAMRRCGNRSKTRAYRARRAQTSTEGKAT
ncbi:MAG: CGNR zinc finger domain-containing protein [Ilumatobacter sp.]|uniref:CGNR zinc finger domain-containing protein n=1 Tax=Ilumatobacter sp. TaxID=1967498 RepID=UPI00260FFF37|nr:CGNR zinc finger domain-containing protein [Ilumatobacter sp.]MDJ0770932.1 CGNR zinc finger domain-containing protein [Ilumatobacter sp.]